MKYAINSTMEQVKSTGCLALAGKISEQIGFDFSDQVAKKEMEKPEVLKALLRFFVQGLCSFEEISVLRHDSFFADTFYFS
jgi:hypothetical protein